MTPILNDDAKFVFLSWMVKKEAVTLCVYVIQGFAIALRHI